MSDLNGINISDLLGLSEPLQKLVETVSCGIGKLYEPIHVRRMANAKAAEIKAIGDQISDISEIPIKYDNGKVLVDGTDYTELVKRTQSRIAFQELKKQQNIDYAVAFAAQELAGELKVSKEPVDEDWVSRFFDSVSCVSEKEMQLIWGKILAGEIKEPGSFSMRTLNVVRNLSKKEAECFLKILPCVMSSDGDFFISSDEKIINVANITFYDILTLDDCGLLYADGTMRMSFTVAKNDPAIMYSDDYAINMTRRKDEPYNGSVGVYKLKTAAQELYPLLRKQTNEEYVMLWARELYNKNFNRCSVDVYKVDGIDNGTPNCQPVPLKNWKEN